MTAVDQKKASELSTVRETVESIWVAIVLAFVLRAFLIEAFVIPTGSMAPRLMGEHWQLNCPSCGFDYAYGLPRPMHGQKRLTQPQRAVCPNCTYPYDFTDRPDFPRGGDRVLVMKYLYNFTEPQPYDVVVFRNPQNNRDNYIKRLIGLPGETLEIVHGDIFYHTGDENWKIRRKPAQVQDAMWQVVFDNDYQPDTSKFSVGRPDKAPPKWDSNSTAWNLAAQNGRKFTFSGTQQQEKLAFNMNSRRQDFLPRYGYNDPLDDMRRLDKDSDVCSDLKLSCVWAPEADNELSLELTGMGYRFKAQLTAAGKASLLCDMPDGVGGNYQQLAQADFDPISTGQKRTVSLQNVDYRVTLSIDGEEILTSTDEQYYPDIKAVKATLAAAYENELPTPEAIIAASGGPCSLTHVKLYRDVYYTCPDQLDIIPMRGNPLGDYARQRGLTRNNPTWGTTGNPIQLRKFDDSSLDEFFVLGDNSPQSRDGRVWTEAAPTLRLWDGDEPLYKFGTMPRYNMIGKAFFVYWPAGYNVPGLPYLPIVPNFGRMRMIR